MQMVALEIKLISAYCDLETEIIGCDNANDVVDDLNDCHNCLFLLDQKSADWGLFVRRKIPVFDIQTRS
jgi:hypothetical protein